VLFIFSPAKSSSPPKLVAKISQSELEGIFHPLGAKPLGSFTANQLYILPYFSPINLSLL